MTESQAKQVWDEAWETARSHLNCSEEWLYSNARTDALQADYSEDVLQMVCKSCGGNNADVPCAYPEGGQPHCLRAAPSESREAWAVSLIQAAIDLMTTDQIGRWTGVRAFLESSDDAPIASPAALTMTDEQRKALEAVIHDYEERGFNRMPRVLKSILTASSADHSGDSADMVAEPVEDVRDAEILHLHRQMAGLRQMLEAAHQRADNAAGISNALQDARASRLEQGGCTRSHPHENMSAECEAKTIAARNAFVVRQAQGVALSDETPVWKMRYPNMQALDRITLPAFTTDPVRMRELINAGATATEYRASSSRAEVERIEVLRKTLFESRDAMRVMAGWMKKSDPAGYSWGVRMVDRANAALYPLAAAEAPNAGDGNG
jgi:hypothetical protein